MTMSVVDELDVHFRRGRRMRQTGKPCPPKPPEEATGMEPESMTWIGWRLELFSEFEKIRRVAFFCGDDLDFCEWADKNE